MSVLFSPWGNQQFSASGTALAVGHKIYSYAAGSSTSLATYTDSTGAVAQTNPIILDSLGLPTNGQIWLTSGLAYKLVWTDAAGVVIDEQDDVTGVTGATSVSQWQASGLTPTYVSATSFTLAGDQTSAFHIGRRLQTTNTAGTIYSTITASAYGALTTVTVVNDSGVLDSGLSQINYGLTTAVNTSLPDSDSVRSIMGVSSNKMIHVRDEKASGTGGGASSAGSQIRTLNTVVTNTITGASLATNQVTLPAGSYRVFARAPALRSNQHRARLTNVTDGTTAVFGTSEYAEATDTSVTASTINGARITITGTKVFSLTHYITTAFASVGALGSAVSDGGVEVYAELIFYKE